MRKVWRSCCATVLCRKSGFHDGWLDLNTTYSYGIVHRMLLAEGDPVAARKTSAFLRTVLDGNFSRALLSYSG